MCKRLRNSKIHLEKLAVSRLNEAVVHRVCIFSSVKQLELRQARLSCASFTPFANLESVLVHRCPGFKISMLPNLPNLHTLRIHATTFPGLLELPFPHLEHLEIDDCSCIFTDSQLSQWYHLNLKTLSLRRNSVWNVDFRPFSNLLGLCAPLFPVALKFLPPTLLVLDLSSSRLFPHSLIELQHLVVLRKLVLDFVPVGDEAIVYLKPLLNLRYLSLVHSQITRGCFPELATLPLEKLGLALSEAIPISSLEILMHFELVLERRAHDLILVPHKQLVS